MTSPEKNGREPADKLQRRSFLKSALALGASAAAAAPAGAADSSAATRPATKPSSRPATAPATAPASALAGGPVVFGPGADSLCIVQPVHGPATGFLELSINDQPFQRIDSESAGLLALDPHVLKFRLPPLPSAALIRYRITARFVDFQTAYKIHSAPPHQTEVHSFKTLDPASAQTRFIVWNDTHENLETIKALHAQTVAFRPDFLMWNGDQTNDIYDPAKLSAQVLCPGGLPIASDYPLAYARGNHDVRGPAARHLPSFTGTPDDRFYYAFRSGPVAALVLDTGEDKPDDHPVFAGLAGFEAMRQRQTQWLAGIIRQPWFREAPFRILFCHIPLWWKDEVTDIGHWRFSKVCRDAWLPLLIEAGVKVVISGHTHEPAWLPPGPDRPVGQLIGASPRPHQATIIEAHATHSRLSVTMKRLNGTVFQDLNFDA